MPESVVRVKGALRGPLNTGFGATAVLFTGGDGIAADAAGVGAAGGAFPLAAPLTGRSEQLAAVIESTSRHLSLNRTRGNYRSASGAGEDRRFVIPEGSRPLNRCHAASRSTRNAAILVSAIVNAPADST